MTIYIKIYVYFFNLKNIVFQFYYLCKSDISYEIDRYSFLFVGIIAANYNKYFSHH